MCWVCWLFGRFSTFPTVEESQVAMTSIALVKPLLLGKFANGTVIVVCMNLMTANVESGMPLAAGLLECISTIGRA